MVLANLATLLAASPRELCDWFWVAYNDAYDWVVEPNVLAMGSFAVGLLMTTKPYVSGAAYLDRMSDYCAACAFEPGSSCPITPLYWAFLTRHAGHGGRQGKAQRLAQEPEREQHRVPICFHRLCGTPAVTGTQGSEPTH